MDQNFGASSKRQVLSAFWRTIFKAKTASSSVAMSRDQHSVMAVEQRLKGWPSISFKTGHAYMMPMALSTSKEQAQDRARLNHAPGPGRGMTGGMQRRGKSGGRQVVGMNVGRSRPGMSGGRRGAGMSGGRQTVGTRGGRQTVGMNGGRQKAGMIDGRREVGMGGGRPGSRMTGGRRELARVTARGSMVRIVGPEISRHHQLQDNHKPDLFDDNKLHDNGHRRRHGGNLLLLPVGEGKDGDSV